MLAHGLEKTHSTCTDTPMARSGRSERFLPKSYS
jgi:hypothetical protein